MDCSTLQHQQETMGSQSLESMIMCTKPQSEQQQEKKPRPADEHALKCPRCDSANTKFCYYNNYSLSQPRYFCKSCRRYWTKGGTLRNVPVGGGCRKNRRSSSSSKKSVPDHHLQVPALCITNPTYDHHTGLTLAHGNISLLGNHCNPQFDLFDNPGGNSLLDTLRSGLMESSHSLYYGNLGDIENGRGNMSLNSSHEDGHEIAMQFDNTHTYNYNSEIMSNASSGSSTPTAVKQELGENRILWGFPWQQLNGEVNYMNHNSGGNMVMDSIREGWNSAIVGSSWNNNLLNSPLM